MQKIVWVANHPTNYIIFLFNYLSKHYELKVYFLEFIKPTHPWNKLAEIKFDYFILKNNSRGYFEIINKSKDKNTILIIANWNRIPINLILFFCSLSKIKFVIWSDTPNIDKRRLFPKKTIRYYWLKYLVNRSIAIMGTGNIAIENFKKMDLNENRLYNFPFFVDLEKFKPDQQTSDSYTDELVFLSSGRLENWHKGYDVALKALGKFKSRTKFENFRYRIAGTGSDLAFIQKLIEENSLINNVELLGWLNEDQLKDFYYSGNVFLHSSRFDPFPNCVLEAMACGLTVIGSNKAGSVVDRIKNDYNGFIFESENDEDLFGKINYIHNNRALLKSFGLNARKTSEEWPIERSKEVIDKFFSSINRIDS